MLELWMAAVAVLGGGEVRRPADLVELKDGKKLECYVLREEADKVIVQVGSREREIALEDIAHLRSAPRTLAEMFRRLNALAPGDAPGRVALAKFCQDDGLPGEAQLLALAALTLDPANEVAHLLAGHTKRKSLWRVERGSRSEPFVELVGVRKDFDDAWRIDTSHYTLTSNLALKEVVGIALDLERFYGAFFELAGRELELAEVVERMYANVYATSAAFPELTGGNVAYFDSQLNQLLVNAERGLDRRAVLHEATHQILHATAERTRASRGEIPAWLNEGLAEYVGWASRGELGSAKFELGVPIEQHFTTHRNATKPFDLGRMLTMGTEDFLASSKVELKYAQAYTLVHFCLHGENQKHREHFFDFVRGAYLGRASMSDFKSALDVRGPQFEKAWSAHVGRKER